MTRTIKFRGYNKKHNKWLFGFYFENRGNGYIVTGDVLDNPFHTPDDFEVDKESVGQFIGLLDKNGIEIYEGDIVSVNIGTKRFPKTVNKEISYFEEYGIFGMRGHQGYGEVDLTIPMGSHGSSTKYSPYLLSSYWRKNIEVIGNIYENPDLLSKN